MNGILLNIAAVIGSIMVVGLLVLAIRESQRSFENWNKFFCEMGRMFRDMIKDATKR